MENNIQTLLDKYEAKPLNSIKLENDILDIEKKIILEKESQIPDLVQASTRPFDKNYCFYGISLTRSTKENIFPKERYFLKSQQVVDLKPIEIDQIFEDDKLFKNADISPSSNNIEKKEDEDEDSVHNQIISSIENHHYKSYIPKNLTKAYFNLNEVDNEWYIISNNNPIEGPFNDFAMYNKLNLLFYDSFSKKEKLPNFLINEKRSDIFMTMDDCYKRLIDKYENNKQSNNIIAAYNQYQNKVMFQYMNNMLLLYQNQMLKSNQMNKNMTSNALNNQKNKNNAPNKFNNNNKDNKNKNDQNNKIKGYNKKGVNANKKKIKDNKNYDKFNNNNGRNNYNNRGNKYFYNNSFYSNNYHNNYNNYNNYHHNKYNKKEKRIDLPEMKENDTQNNNEKVADDNKIEEKKEIKNEHSSVVEKKEESKIIDKEEFFRKE